VHPRIANCWQQSGGTFDEQVSREISCRFGQCRVLRPAGFGSGSGASGRGSGLRPAPAPPPAPAASDNMSGQLGIGVGVGAGGTSLISTRDAEINMKYWLSDTLSLMPQLRSACSPQAAFPPDIRSILPRSSCTAHGRPPQPDSVSAAVSGWISKRCRREPQGLPQGLPRRRRYPLTPPSESRCPSMRVWSTSSPSGSRWESPCKTTSWPTGRMVPPTLRFRLRHHGHHSGGRIPLLLHGLEDQRSGPA